MTRGRRRKLLGVLLGVLLGALLAPNSAAAERGLWVRTATWQDPLRADRLIADAAATGARTRHKAAIDAHLADVGIPLSYTNVFWGGRSEIKPSEIAPSAYRDWCASVDLDPEEMV